VKLVTGLVKNRVLGSIGQVLQRLCHHHSDLSSFTSAFASRGYPLPLLQCQIHCTPPSTLPKTKLICPLITTYHPSLHSLKCILKESHHILLSDLSTPSFSSFFFNLPQSVSDWAKSNIYLYFMVLKSNNMRLCSKWHSVCVH
jgi:hypothetical protein